jgi:hypothetical protein
MYAELQMALLTVKCTQHTYVVTTKTKTTKTTTFQLNKVLQTPSYLFFIPKLQVPEIPAIILVDPVAWLTWANHHLTPSCTPACCLSPPGVPLSPVTLTDGIADSNVLPSGMLSTLNILQN